MKSIIKKSLSSLSIEALVSRKIFIQYSLKEVTEKLRFSEVTFGILSHSNDHSKDQQFIESEVLVKFDEGSFDEDFLTVNSPIFLENESKKIPTKAPKLGEHTKEILSSLRCR